MSPPKISGRKKTPAKSRHAAAPESRVPGPESRLLISNARILDPASGFDGVGHLGIHGESIVHIGKGKPKGAFDQIVDGKGLWLIPALVDLAARFREPGQSHKATFASETPAAQAGGIGAIVLPPDTIPPVDSPAVVSRIQHSAGRVGGLDVHILGALTKGLAGEALSEMSALRQAGCVGVGNGLAPAGSALIARHALDYARGLGLTVHVFAQDAALANGGCAHEGPVATRLGLPPIPAAAEVAAIRHWISLVEDTGASIHFCRLSTARGAGLVESAQKRRLPVSADVAAHQLFLTDADVDGFRAMCHVLPPLRAAEDRAALREAVRRGVIAAICSDHQPHEPDAKINPFPLTEPGISALETLLPLVLRLVHEKALPALDAIARLTCGPARIAGIAAGSLQTGNAANLALVDPGARWTLRASELLSAGRNTPFHGSELRGRVLRTLYRGRTVFLR